MKYIKTYEISQKAINYYVICKESNPDDIRVTEFLSNNIGLIYKYDNNYYDFIVKYENVPENIHDYFNYNNYNNCRPMYNSEIVHWSKNKKDLEIYISANKYNL